MFRNILVHIPSERPVRPVIDVAVALTFERRAHLDAVAIGYESMSAVGMVVEGGSAAVAAVMGVEQEQALERANAAISVFEVEAKLAKIDYGTRTIAAIPAEAEQAIGALARLYDLTVVLQPDPSFSSYDNIIPQGILVQFRRPHADGSLHSQGTARRAPRRDRLGRKQVGRPRVARCTAVSDRREAVTVIAVNEDRQDAERSDPRTRSSVISHDAASRRVSSG